MFSTHAEVLRCKSSEHDKQLLQLEHQVKLSIYGIQQQNLAVQTEIEDVGTALQQTLQLIKGYQKGQ
jgi:hypothetical protein